MPEAADLPAMPLLNACIQETLRLYPPAWLLPRQATRPVTVAGMPLAEGDNVSVNIFLIQRNARFWPAQTRTPEAFLPFSLGARMCIANHLALLEAGLTAALALRDFTLDVPGGGPTSLNADVTLGPDSPVLAQVRRT